MSAQMKLGGRAAVFSASMASWRSGAVTETLEVAELRGNDCRSLAV